MLFCTTGGRLPAALVPLTVPCGDPGGGGRGLTTPTMLPSASLGLPAFSQMGPCYQLSSLLPLARRPQPSAPRPTPEPPPPSPESPGLTVGPQQPQLQ